MHDDGETAQEAEQHGHCGAYAESSCCSYDMLERIYSQDSMRKQDYTTSELGDFAKMLKQGGFNGMSDSCRTFLEDRLGCIRCHPEADKYIDVDQVEKTVTLKMCDQYQLDFEKECADFWASKDSYDKNWWEQVKSSFTLDSQTPKKMSMVFNDIKHGPGVAHYTILWDTSSCLYVNHTPFPTIYKVLIAAGSVVFLAIVICCSCCCKDKIATCCGCKSKPRKGAGPAARMMGAPNQNMPGYSQQAGASYASHASYGSAVGQSYGGPSVGVGGGPVLTGPPSVGTGPVGPMGGGPQIGFSGAAAQSYHTQGGPQSAYDGGKHGRI